MIKTGRRKKKRISISSSSLNRKKSSIQKKSLSDGHVNISVFKNMLRKLKENLHLNEKDLDETTKKDFKKFKKIILEKRDNKELYGFILDMVKDEFLDIDDVSPGTIGAYFKGCFSDENLPDDQTKNCSLLCSSSMKPKNEIYKDCDVYVIYITASEFEIINYADSNKAIVYYNGLIPQPKNNKGKNLSTEYIIDHILTSNNIDELRNLGILVVDIYWGGSSIQYKMVEKNYYIDEDDESEDDDDNYHETKKRKMSSSYIISFIVFLFILFLFILLVLWYNKQQRK